jgi:sRNA-binding protein
VLHDIWADWRKRWPAAFTTPVPLAIGVSGQIKAVLRSEGAFNKMARIAIYRWTLRPGYLNAVVRGEKRRNLDGTLAGVPTHAEQAMARKVMEERTARRALFSGMGKPKAKATKQ